MFRKNKKGISFEALIWIPRILFLTAGIFTIVFAVKTFYITEVDVFDVETSIFARRLVYSPGGLSYFDKVTGRNYPGIIDENKFYDNEFKNSLVNLVFYGKDNRHIAANIILYDEKGNQKQSMFYNEEYYKTWNELWKGLQYSRNIKDPGGYRKTARQMNVLYSATGLKELKKGGLKIEIIIPNS